MDLPATPDDLYHYERLARDAGHTRVIGIDEAGRGPLAGPVVVAAVILPPDVRLDGLNDSKQLTEARREAIYVAIMADARILHAIVAIDPLTIDRLNIYGATVHGMWQVARELRADGDIIFVDGRPVKGLPPPSRGIVKGDGKCAAIAAASVLAKVTRDRLMLDLHARHPQYGFDRHKGYPTAVHLAALREHGPIPAHRRTFGPVAATLPQPPAQSDLALEQQRDV